MKQTKKNKSRKFKLRINPKNAETRSGTLATPEAFDPAVQSVTILRRLIGEKAARKTNDSL